MNGPVLHGLADGATVRITGGEVTPEEVAAVVLALDAARAAERRSSEPRPEPAWLRAARRELLGGPPVASPTDLR